jgi:transcription initiation factor TFIID TATA-box-binding protein
VDTAFKVVNVVATVALDRRIDLDRLRDRIPHQVTYNPEKYSGLVAYFKSKNMEGKVSIFRSGKMISVGTKSPERAMKELKFVSKKLKASLKTRPKIQSIVATADFKTSIDLESFLSRLQQERKFHAIYEPEQFPGAIIKFSVKDENKATILLFASGKLVSAGMTNLDLIQEAINTIESKLAP